MMFGQHVNLGDNMIICNKQKVVFVAVPKTGTRSIYKVLQNQYNGQRLSDHLQVVPKQYKNYFTFIIKRNPYDRACSLYWALCRRNPTFDQYGWLESLKQKKFENNFENFLKIAISGKRHRIDHPIPQHRFHNRNRIDAILRFENLQEDFNNLPFVKEWIELPRMNITVGIKSTPDKIRVPRPPWKEIINDKSIQLINQIYAEDFKLLGYEMIK